MESTVSSKRPDTDAFVPTWKKFMGKTLHDTSLLAIGYGDGGGGTTPEMVEREEQLRLTKETEAKIEQEKTNSR